MFPSWRYHATKGSRLFNDPNELERAGSGWADSPAAVGLEADATAASSATGSLPGPMSFKAIQQPQDESVATAAEIEHVQAKKKKPVEPVTKRARRAKNL